MTVAPLKILYLLHDSRRSGVPAVMASLIRSLDRRRVQPAVLFAYEGVYAEDLRAAGVPVSVVGRRLPFVWRLNRFLLNLQLIRRIAQADIVHVNSVSWPSRCWWPSCSGPGWSFICMRRRGAVAGF